MTKDKILIATGIFPPDIGGPATYSKLISEELPKRGIDVEVLSFGEVRHLPKLIRHFVYFFKLLYRSRDCCLIFAQDPVSVGLPSLFASCITGKKFFIRVAGDYAWEQSCQRFGVKDGIDDFQKRKYGLKVELLRMIQKFVVKHSDLTITPSKYFRELVSNWNNGKTKVKHIYNGIEFPASLPKKSEARERLGISKEAKVIVSAGRLVPWKGFDTLIETLPILKDDSVELYILGDGPERIALENKIANTGLERKVFLTGSVPREKMFAYLLSADVFVLNTSFESFSFQIVEAMYSEVPVISTNIGNIPEIIDNEFEGILIAPDDIKAMSSSLERIFSDKYFVASIIKNAKAKSMEFSISRTIDNLEACISEYVS